MNDNKQEYVLQRPAAYKQFLIFLKKIIHHQSKLFSKFLEKNEKSNNIKKYSKIIVTDN